MFRLRTQVVPVLALLAALGCGGASFFIAGGNGQLLVVVSVHPNSADAIQFPNGQVPFTAQGTFQSPASVGSLSNVVWTVDRPAFSLLPDLGHASINQNGLATCASGFVGIVQVFATAPADPSLAMSAQNAIVGTAHLVCP
jgi:hypothetical protein